MIKIENLTTKLADSEEIILKEISIDFEKGKTYAIKGRNGSGKSTLLQTIMGNPAYEITAGTITLNGEDISETDTNERSLKGIFLANQQPPEIEGVSLLQYLRMIYNLRLPEDEKMPVFAFKDYLYDVAELVSYPQELLSRNLNEGFSGGEKKKTEILQALLIEPTYWLLDEVDSGLDKESIEDVFSGLAEYKNRNPETTFLIVSHHEHVFDYLKPDEVIELKKGEVFN